MKLTPERLVHAIQETVKVKAFGKWEANLGKNYKNDQGQLVADITRAEASAVIVLPKKDSKNGRKY